MNTINGVNSSEIIVGAQDEENTIVARAGNDRVYGGQLADNLGGGADIDGIWGLSGDDVISGGTGGDFASGSVGNDTITGGEGNDYLWGGKGEDVIVGGKGNDVMHGNTGNDVMSANSGDDAVYGLAGDDVINAGSGNDFVTAGSGNDRVVASTGNDVSFGGSGYDTLDFSGIGSAVSIDLSKNTASFGKEGYVQTINSFEQVIGGNGGTHFMGSDSGNTTFIGGTGDDWMRGKGGSDVLTGGDGHDTFAYLKKDTAGDAVDTITDFHVGEDRLDMSDFLKGHTDYSQSVRIVDGADGAHVQGLVKHQWVDVVTLAGVEAHDMTLADLGLLAA